MLGSGRGSSRLSRLALRRQVVRSDDALQRRGMAELIANALKPATPQTAKGSEPVRSVPVTGKGSPKGPTLN